MQYWALFIFVVTIYNTTNVGTGNNYSSYVVFLIHRIVKQLPLSSFRQMEDQYSEFSDLPTLGLMNIDRSTGSIDQSVNQSINQQVHYSIKFNFREKSSHSKHAFNKIVYDVE